MNHGAKYSQSSEGTWCTNRRAWGAYAHPRSASSRTASSRATAAGVELQSAADASWCTHPAGPPPPPPPPPPPLAPPSPPTALENSVRARASEAATHRPNMTISSSALGAPGAKGDLEGEEGDAVVPTGTAVERPPSGHDPPPHTGLSQSMTREAAPETHVCRPAAPVGVATAPTSRLRGIATSSRPTSALSSRRRFLSLSEGSIAKINAHQRTAIIEPNIRRTCTSPACTHETHHPSAACAWSFRWCFVPGYHTRVPGYLAKNSI